MSESHLGSWSLPEFLGIDHHSFCLLLRSSQFLFVAEMVALGTVMEPTTLCFAVCSVGFIVAFR